MVVRSNSKLEDEINSRLSHSHHGGRASAFEEVTDHLNFLAGDFYVHDKTAEAKFAKDLAKLVDEWAKEDRNKQKKYLQ